MKRFNRHSEDKDKKKIDDKGNVTALVTKKFFRDYGKLKVGDAVVVEAILDDTEDTEDTENKPEGNLFIWHVVKRIISSRVKQKNDFHNDDDTGIMWDNTIDTDVK
jgi:hypothetical protein